MTLRFFALNLCIDYRLRTARAASNTKRLGRLRGSAVGCCVRGIVTIVGLWIMYLRSIIASLGRGAPGAWVPDYAAAACVFHAVPVPDVWRVLPERGARQWA